jgi:hypothetical protein
VSSSQELEKELEELAKRNACAERNTARTRRWKLVCDLNAVQKRLARKLNPEELMKSFDKWHRNSLPYLNPKKTRDDYCGLFLAEFGKVRVPTGEGEALKKALEHILTLSVFELPALPGIAQAPESWRRLAALHWFRHLPTRAREGREASEFTKQRSQSRSRSTHAGGVHSAAARFGGITQSSSRQTDAT